MASAAEQLAASINFGAFSKATELKSRIWFTLGALVIYRLGTYIPIPGIDPGILHDIFQRLLKTYSADQFCPEPVHPSPAGHTVMAEAWLREMGW